MRITATMLGGAALVGAMLAAGSSVAAPTAQGQTPTAAQQNSSATPAGTEATPMDNTNSAAKQPANSAANSPFATGSHSRTGMKMVASEPITQVSDPQSALKSADVQDSTGTMVGKVAHVTTNSSGKVESVNVSLDASGRTSAKQVEIKAAKLRYSPTAHMLQVKATRQQLQSMPNASGGIQADMQTP